MLRTNDCEINFHIPRGRVAKVHAASVDTLVPQQDVVHEQLGRMRCGAEEGTVGKGGRRGPQFRLRHTPCPHVEAARGRRAGKVGE